MLTLSPESTGLPKLPAKATRSNGIGGTRVKKLLIGILAVLLLVVGAVLVIPSLIDWNTYKAEIAERIGAATGRAVTLEGDIDLALLPRPTLSVTGARLANLPGASLTWSASASWMSVSPSCRSCAAVSRFRAWR